MKYSISFGPVFDHLSLGPGLALVKPSGSSASPRMSRGYADDRDDEDHDRSPGRDRYDDDRPAPPSGRDRGQDRRDRRRRDDDYDDYGYDDDRGRGPRGYRDRPTPRRDDDDYDDWDRDPPRSLGPPRSRGYDDRDRDYYDDRDRYRDSRSPKHVDYSKHKSSSMSSIAGDMSKRRELWRCAALHRLWARARVRAAARRGSKLGGERPA